MQSRTNAYWMILWIFACLGLEMSRAQITPRANDTFLFYGNSMVERLLEAGELEAIAQLAHPTHKLRFRSLAWTGDEVGHRLRPEGYAEHMRAILKEWPAQYVVIGFGMNESFGGNAGLAEFRAQFTRYLDQLLRLHPGARFVLLTPIAVEPGWPGPEAGQRNRDIAEYARAIVEIAGVRGAVAIDLYAGSSAAYRESQGKLTSNGIHLNGAGNSVIARLVASKMFGEPAIRSLRSDRIAEVARAAERKHHYVAEVIRPKNADLYYGVRKRPEENSAEIPRYFQMIAATESIVHQMAGSDRTLDSFPRPWLQPLPPIQGSDDGPQTGVIKTPAESLAEFKVAEGYAVNLFASEEQFPDLRNPVQIAFDSRGRLWIVTMPSFPHTVPGLPPEDKLLVLEDTDRDGRADKSTVFAEGLDALDGVAFCEDGVIVSEQPRLWLMRDTNGDGRADEKRELLRGIDVTDSHHGGMIAADPAGHVWFCDGVFHRSQLETPYGVHRAIDSATFRWNRHTGRVETEWQSITPNPWKITFDRYGNIFQMYGDGLVLDGLQLTWTPMAVYHPFAHAKVLGYGKGSAAASVSSPNFPDEYQQGMASAALLGSYVVSLTKLDLNDGAARGSGRLDLITSTNAAFRPADLEFGWDGALYVSDFCSAIIGHAQHPMRDPHWDHSHGRIWRVVNTARPVARDWPQVDGVPVESLLSLFGHPQDIVRHHARIELRKRGESMLPAVDRWIAGWDRAHPQFSHAALEAIFVAEGFGQVRPHLLADLLMSKNPLYRAAGVRMIRYQADRLPEVVERLGAMAMDRHPRVCMEVVDAIAHLRPSIPTVESVISLVSRENGDVKQMLADLQHGTKPAKGRSVPVLEIPAETRIPHWLWLGAKGDASPVYFDRSSSSKAPGNGLYRTFVRSGKSQSATIDIHHGFLDIAVNGVQLLSFDSMWSNDQQVQFELRPGINLLDVHFRQLRGRTPQVHLFDAVGDPLGGVQFPKDEASLRELLAEWEKENAALGDVVRIQCAPGTMQFSPKEFRVKRGAKVRLLFENPDLMLHNFVLVAAGSGDEVGKLADQLAMRPGSMARQYVPDSPKVLAATKLVNPKGKSELQFTAPLEPGQYPYLCTFPGHWRLMKGVMVVE